MDSTFMAILILAGILFLIVLTILTILVPFFVFRIRNEVVKLNMTVSKSDMRLRAIGNELEAYSNRKLWDMMTEMCQKRVGKK